LGQDGELLINRIVSLANSRFGYLDKPIFLNLKCEIVNAFRLDYGYEHLRFKKMLQAQAGEAGRAGIRQAKIARDVLSDFVREE
jgi:hypothetical protein